MTRKEQRLDHIDGLVQDCSNSIANALEILQSWSRSKILWSIWRALVWTLTTVMYNSLGASSSNGIFISSSLSLSTHPLSARFTPSTHVFLRGPNAGHRAWRTAGNVSTQEAKTTLRSQWLYPALSLRTSPWLHGWRTTTTRKSVTLWDEECRPLCERPCKHTEIWTVRYRLLQVRCAYILLAQAQRNIFIKKLLKSITKNTITLPKLLCWIS